MATRYNYTGGIVTNGLVLNLDAAKTDSYPGTGTTWRDLSGNSNNGTLTNGPTFSGIGKQASIVFDGVDDYVNLGSPNSSKLTFGSLCSWVYLKSGGVTFQQVVGKRTAGNAPGFDYMLDLSSTGTNIRGLISNGSSFNMITGITTLNYDTWYYICFTWDGSNLKIYLNGISNSTPVTQTITPQITDNPLDIAIAKDPSPRYFKGNIADTQIYNRALSAQEALQNFNALRGRYGI